MQRSEIKTMVEGWIQSGLITSKRNSGLSYAEINKEIAKGRLLPTSYRSVIATDLYVRDNFERLVHEGKLVDVRGVQVICGYKTLYDIKKAVANGEIDRIETLGRAALLYII